jgi:hypothetical protein
LSKRYILPPALYQLCLPIVRRRFALLFTYQPALFSQDNEGSSDEDSNFGFGEDIAEDDFIRPKARETALKAMISGAPLGTHPDVLTILHTRH